MEIDKLSSQGSERVCQVEHASERVCQQHDILRGFRRYIVVTVEACDGAGSVDVYRRTDDGPSKAERRLL